MLVGSVVFWTVVWFLSCHCLFNFVCWIPQCVLPLSCCQQNTSSNRSCKALGQMRGRGCALVMFMPLTTKEIKLPTLNSIVCSFLWPHSKFVTMAGETDENDNKAENKRENSKCWGGRDWKGGTDKIKKFIPWVIWPLIFCLPWMGCKQFIKKRVP